MPTSVGFVLFRIFFRDFRYAAVSILLLASGFFPAMQAKGLTPACPIKGDALGSRVVTRAISPELEEGTEPFKPSLRSGAANKFSATSRRLIVIGFMGGHVRAGNLVHREAQVAEDLQMRYPLAVHAAVFANHDGSEALKTVLQLLDTNGDGCVSPKEKKAARIVIYGHSWGGSETVALARRLNRLGIPVLLTIQVDSVEKSNENDGRIPPNVRQAINFYQSDGLLHGRSLIEAADPAKTDILGNFESTYRRNPVSCAGYPWYARAFMKSHIEIENDPLVWGKIEALIKTKVLASNAPAGDGLPGL